MKKNLLTLFALIFSSIIFVSCSSDSDSINTPTIESEKSYYHSDFELELLDLVNEYRVSQGKNALTIIEHISYKSGEHNDYMIVTNSVNHDGFTDRKANLQQVLGAVKVGENVAYGYSTPQATLNAWIESEGHRANLLGEYTHFGLSTKQNDLGQKYYTNMFIKK